LVSLGPRTRDRLLALALGLPSWAVLATALRLQPDPEGHGTHLQLGLGTCSFLEATAHPCPVCGMTTSFAHMAHAQPLQAVAVQPFGTALFLLTVAVALVAVADLVRPQQRLLRAWAWTLERERLVAGILFGGLLLGWVYKLAVWSDP